MNQRNCPSCDKVIEYRSKRGFDQGNQRNSKCRSCLARGKNNNFYGKTHSDETLQKMKIAHKGKTHSDASKRKMQGRIAWNKGLFLSKEHCENLSKSHIGQVSWSKGRKIGSRSLETKRKMRLSAIARIERNLGQVFPSYNPDACKLIEEYGKQHGFNFQHAENGGEFHIKELGFWVDGYDVEQNVVIAVDEPRHYQNGKLKQKDVSRQKEIEGHLDCKFIRMRV